jgi:hypothetical protein
MLRITDHTFKTVDDRKVMRSNKSNTGDERLETMDPPEPHIFKNPWILDPRT